MTKAQLMQGLESIAWPELGLVTVPSALIGYGIGGKKGLFIGMGAGIIGSIYMISKQAQAIANTPDSKIAELGCFL